MNEIVNRISNLRILPLIDSNDIDFTVKLAEVFFENGFSNLEIVLRHPNSIKSLGVIKKELPDMLVGAGTILNLNMALEAMDYGADFLVSPGLDEDTAKHAVKNNITYFPGTCTPTEIMACINLGINHVKFFPSVPIGGVPMLSLLSSVFRNVKFLPTGGINKTNINDFLAINNVIAAGGSWFASLVDQENNDYSKVKEEIKTVLDLVKT